MRLQHVKQSKTVSWFCLRSHRVTVDWRVKFICLICCCTACPVFMSLTRTVLESVTCISPSVSFQSLCVLTYLFSSLSYRIPLVIYRPHYLWLPHFSFSGLKPTWFDKFSHHILPSSLKTATTEYYPVLSSEQIGFLNSLFYFVCFWSIWLLQLVLCQLSNTR